MMIRSAIPGGQTLDIFRSKPNFFSNLSFESYKCFRPNWFPSSPAGQGITTSTSNTRGKEEKEVVDSMIKPVKMAYTSYEQAEGGDATEPPVIIMHGLLGSKSNWNSLCRVIHNKTKRKVIAVDARNHGESPHTMELTYNHLAVDIKEFMNDLNIPKATLVGHSMGGRAVMMAALKYPELVKDLVVVDISPFRTSPNLKHMLKCFEAMRLVRIEPKVPLSSARKSADSQLSKYIMDPGLRQFLLTNLVEGEDGKYKWRVNLDSIASNFAINLTYFPSPIQHVYNGPTLFIGGTASDYLLKEEESDIKKVFPNASFSYVQDAGHWIHTEKPQEFLNIVNGFIQGEQTQEVNERKGEKAE